MERNPSAPADAPAAVVPDHAHQRPAGCTDATVDAMGKVGEAWEWVERLRGRLYDFHQMIGRADRLFGDAADALDAAGHHDEAKQLREIVVGRNVLDGRWSFQIVEEFDDCYYRPTAQIERAIRHSLIDGKAHVYEAEMKEGRRTDGIPGHESRPPLAET